MDKLLPNRIILYIVGKNLDPDKVTKAVGIEPYLQMQRGEPLVPDRPNARKSEQGVWELCIESRLKPHILLKIFTDRLRPYRKELASVRSWKTVHKTRSHLAIVVSPSEKIIRCVVGLRAKDIHFWGSLGFDICVNCWIWGRVQSEPSRKRKKGKIH